RTVRFVLHFDPQTIRLARDRWQRLALYATPFRNLLDQATSKGSDRISCCGRRAVLAGVLYLDTARLGRMSPSARRAHQDFVAMAGEEGGSLYFDRFLQVGASSLDPGRYPGLAGWHGIAALKRCLRGLAGASPQSPVLIA